LARLKTNREKMAGMKTLKPVDVVVAGGGWSGLLIAKDLATRTSLEVLVLERGPARGLKEHAEGMDEVDYVLRNRMMQNPAEQTITHRHSPRDRPAPIRQYGSFKPGTGTGGSGEHWGGISDRYLEDFFVLETRLKERYGAGKLPAGLSVQDWGTTYAETSFHKTATELGYHPYPLPASNLSRTYTNPDGVSRAGCVYCGYCPSFGCMIGAKAQPRNTLLRMLRKRSNFTLRNNCCVRRVVHRSGKAAGVMYMDESEEETLQPADIVILAAWTPQNTRFLTLSGIGHQYDPQTAGPRRSACAYAGAPSTVQRLGLQHHAYTGRRDYGDVARAQRRQYVAAALEHAESFCGGVVLFPAELIRESHADDSDDAAGGRWNCRTLSEETGVADMRRFYAG
jgi:gluconate 2-dehydrogenase alpha chain